MSPVGIALLFDRAGGSLTGAMSDAIEKSKVRGPHAEHLMQEIRERWDVWDLKDKGQDDNMLQFDSFYDGFMAPYFSCYRCLDTQKAMQAIDMDSDGMVDWSEFELYLKWALNAFPEIQDVDELLETAFLKGLIPAMQEELLKGQVDKVSLNGNSIDQNNKCLIM